MRNLRFEQELEFVQLLCNPDYIRWLFDEGYFDNDNFKRFLEYLNYWKTDDYKIFLTYPTCLNILDILNREDVKDLLKDESFYVKLGSEQYYLWKDRKTKNIIEDLI